LSDDSEELYGDTVARKLLKLEVLPKTRKSDVSAGAETQ
jgi:hypothetical protein